jgi:uncharacterized protein (TIGR03086 family)
VVTSVLDGIVDRYEAASAGFARRLRLVGPAQWRLPTPCTEWDVRQLVDHMARGNLNYVALAAGGSAAQFLAQRDADALGADPLAAYLDSVRACHAAFGAPGVLIRVLDYPLGRVTGAQALAVRTADTVVHTWDLARALDADERLDAELVGWLDGGLEAIYAGLAEAPTAPDTTHRFFAAPDPTAPSRASRQDRLLNRLGRTP